MSGETNQAAALAAQSFLTAAVPEGPIAAALKRQIETEVAAIVPEHKHVAVLGVATADGWRVTGAVRVGQGFQLSGDVGQAWGGEVSGRVAVLATF